MMKERVFHKGRWADVLCNIIGVNVCVGTLKTKEGITYISHAFRVIIRKHTKTMHESDFAFSSPVYVCVCVCLNEK